MRLDRRHYNAWYGIGLTYYKQERFQLAEIYYRCSKLKRLEYQPNVSPRRALAISPNSPVLMCHVAVVQVFADQFHDFNNQSNIWHLWPITFSARHQQHPSCHRDPHQCSQNIAKVYFQHVLHQQILSQDVDIRNAYMLRLCFKFYLNAIMISGTPCASSSGPPYFTPVTETKKPWRSCFF